MSWSFIRPACNSPLPVLAAPPRSPRARGGCEHGTHTAASSGGVPASWFASGLSGGDDGGESGGPLPSLGGNFVRKCGCLQDLSDWLPYRLVASLVGLRPFLPQSRDELSGCPKNDTKSDCSDLLRHYTAPQSDPGTARDSLPLLELQARKARPSSGRKPWSPRDQSVISSD